MVPALLRIRRSDFPAEPAEESAYKPTETPVSVHESVAEPVESKTDERNHDSIEDTLPLTSAGTQQLQPLSAVETLKHSEQIGRQSTPEIAAEVADTAALLDCPTPEPEASDETAGKLEEEQPATILERAAEADIAAEVADSAEKLDADEASQYRSIKTSFVNLTFFLARGTVGDGAVTRGSCSRHSRGSC